MDFLSAEQFPWLSKKVFDNTALEYILAFLTFLLLWFFLSFLRHHVITRLTKLVDGHRGSWYHFLINLIASVKTIVFLAVAIFVATRRLELTPTLDKWLTHIVAVIVIFQMTHLIGRASAHFVNHFTFGRASDDLSLKSARNNLSAIMQVAIWVAGLLFLLSNLGINITTFITGLGIGGIAIALAAQAVLGDVFSSFTIAIDKPFEVGDFIIVDNLRGTIEQIGLKTTRIRSIDGELLVISNSDLTKSRIKNFKRMENRRVNFTVSVSFATEIEKLKEIPKILKEAILANKRARFDRAAFMTIGTSSLDFDVVYYVESQEYAVYCEIHQNVNLTILSEFAKRKIQLAVTTPPATPAHPAPKS